MDRRRSTISLAVFLLLLLSSGSTPVFSEQNSSIERPRIILSALTASAGDTVAETLASTITASLDLVMRLTGRLAVERADFLTPTEFFDRALGYYRQVGADGAVFGSVSTKASGGYSIDLEIWKATTKDTKPVEVKRTITDLLSSFDVADEISLDVASTVVGRKLSEGTLIVSNAEKLPAYSVFADGQLLGRNRSEFRVLTGQRVIIIAKPGPVGDIPIETFHVDITVDKATTVVLTEATPSKPRPVIVAPSTRPQPLPKPESRFFGGINLGHFFAVAATAKLLESSSAYLPIQFGVMYARTKHWGLGTTAVYQLNSDGPQFAEYSTQEVGLVAGPAYFSDSVNGFFLEAQIGIGYAFGYDGYVAGAYSPYSTSSYIQYSRIDVVLLPQAGTFLHLSSHIGMTIGLGLQSLLKISESSPYTSSLNSLGDFYYHYLPVLNVSIGILE